MAGATAATADSSLRNIIVFIVLKLLNTLTSKNGDIKKEDKVKQIHWNVRPLFWPEDICFANPNTSLTTAEKWSMLFTSLSCLLRRDIEKLLSEREIFALCVELKALENSNIEIMSACHEFRIQAKYIQERSLRHFWVKEFLDKLLSSGLNLPERYTGEDSTRILSIYHDLEQLCKNGRQPGFLKKLKSFHSMGSLDAESALNIAKECLELKSTTSKKRQSSGRVPNVNSKRPKTPRQSSQSATRPANGTSTQYPPILTIATPLPTLQNRMMPTTAATIPTSSTPLSGIQSRASRITYPPLAFNQVMHTAPPRLTSHTHVQRKPTSQIRTTQPHAIQATVSSLSTVAAPLPDTQNILKLATVPPFASQNSAKLIPASPISIKQSPVMPATASSFHVRDIHNSGMQTAASQTRRVPVRMPHSATSPRPVTVVSVTSLNNSFSIVASSHLPSTLVCTASGTSTQTTAIASRVSSVNTRDPLLSSSGSHMSPIPIDTCNVSLHDQTRKTFADNAFSGSSTWSTSLLYCDAFDEIFTVPDPV